MFHKGIFREMGLICAGPPPPVVLGGLTMCTDSLQTADKDAGLLMGRPINERITVPLQLSMQDTDCLIHHANPLRPPSQCG